MEKDGSSGSAGKDTELDALLSAADQGMLDAIRDNLDLDTGFAQTLSDLAGITPASPATGPAQAAPRGHAHSYGHALDRYVPAGFPAQRARSWPRSARRPAENRAVTAGR